MGAAGEGRHRLARWAAVGGAVCALLPFMVSAQTPPSRSAAGNADAACAGCHRTIYEHYEATPMARASGAAMDGLMEGSFTHAASGVHYKVYERDGACRLSYARPETAPGGYLNGEVKLANFIGSNARGGSFD